jgi:hypothetical protein
MEELYFVCINCGETFKEESGSWITPIMFTHQENHIINDGEAHGFTILPESEAM